MMFCNQFAITDEAFRHLGGLEALNIYGCDQVGITEAAFQHLTNLSATNVQRILEDREEYQSCRRLQQLWNHGISW